MLRQGVLTSGVQLRECEGREEANEGMCVCVCGWVWGVEGVVRAGVWDGFERCVGVSTWHGGGDARIPYDAPRGPACRRTPHPLARALTVILCTAVLPSLARASLIWNKG